MKKMIILLTCIFFTGLLIPVAAQVDTTKQLKKNQMRNPPPTPEGNMDHSKVLIDTSQGSVNKEPMADTTLGPNRNKHDKTQLKQNFNKKGMQMEEPKQPLRGKTDRTLSDSTRRGRPTAK